MKYLIFQLLILISIPQMILFDFNPESKINNWRIVDDVVMGGRSNGDFKLNKDGHGEFYGEISLKNNGGFSSVRYNFETINSSDYNSFSIKLKGDGNKFQLRVKDSNRHRYSYVYEFTTTGKWETITIPFNKMKPQFRGRKLDYSNFEGNKMVEIAFLIGNKKEESFKLLIDSISLQ